MVCALEHRAFDVLISPWRRVNAVINTEIPHQAFDVGRRGVGHQLVDQKPEDGTVHPLVDA